MLLVDKPAGMTSFDVVAITRKAFGEKSIGHLGTLDPFATGLLILLLGKSTRLGNFMVTEPKLYEATIKFGSETDTDDCTGSVIRTAELPKKADINKAIKGLTGKIEQVPPAYSAKHVGGGRGGHGTRAYEAARRGETVILKPVQVTVNSWEIVGHSKDEMRVLISCGTGTYVRALARDLGKACNSAAHLTQLRRISSGPFHVDNAATVDQVKAKKAQLYTLSVVAEGISSAK
jgi:tRNA pseudouridine55 synthase